MPTKKVLCHKIQNRKAVSLSINQRYVKIKRDAAFNETRPKWSKNRPFYLCRVISKAVSIVTLHQDGIRDVPWPAAVARNGEVRFFQQEPMVLKTGRSRRQRKLCLLTFQITKFSFYFYYFIPFPNIDIKNPSTIVDKSRIVCVFCPYYMKRVFKVHGCP